MDRMDQYYVCYACKRDSSCSCIFGVRLGLIESTAEPQASPSTYFLRTWALPCSPWGPSASATISFRGSLAPASDSLDSMRHEGQGPFNTTLSVAALDVACSCCTRYVMRVKTWGSRSERLEKWGSTERILLVVFGAGTSGR